MSLEWKIDMLPVRRWLWLIIVVVVTSVVVLGIVEVIFTSGIGIADR